jgi:hypothetical protein
MILQNRDFANHIFVVSSIILGLGITELLSGVGSWIRNAPRIKHSVPLVLWCFLSFVAIVQSWWALDNNFTHPPREFWLYFVRVVSDTSMFLLARLVLPDFSSPDVAKYFEKDENGRFIEGKEYKYDLGGYYSRNVANLSIVSILVITMLSFHEYLYYHLGNVAGWQDKFYGKMTIRAGFVLLLVFTGGTGYFYSRRGEPLSSRWKAIHVTAIVLFAILLAFFIKEYS